MGSLPIHRNYRMQTTHTTGHNIVIGGFHHQGKIQMGKQRHDSVQAVVDIWTFLAVVKNGYYIGAQLAVLCEKAKHDGIAAFHVGRATTVEFIFFDANWLIGIGGYGVYVTEQAYHWTPFLLGWTHHNIVTGTAEGHTWEITPQPGLYEVGYLFLLFGRARDLHQFLS